MQEVQSVRRWKFGVAAAILVVTCSLVSASAQAQDAAPATPANPAAQDDDSATPPSEQAVTPEVAPPSPAAEGASDQTGADASRTEQVDEAAEEEHKPLKWRNSIFTFDQTLSANTFSQEAQLSYNPTYAWSFNIRPRWYFTDQLFVAVSQGLDIEITDTDGRERNREPILSDMFIDLTYNNLLSLPTGVGPFNVSAGVRLVLPVSIVSRARDLYFGVGPSVATRLAINDVLSGWLLGTNMRWTHNVAGNNVTEVDNPYPCFNLDSNQQVCSSAGGFSTDSDAIIATLFSSLSIFSDLTFDVSFTWWWRFGHELGPATVIVNGDPVTFDDMSDTHMRLATNFTIGGSYNVMDWLNLSLNLSTFSAEFNDNGSRRNPFFNVYDSVIDLAATMVIDQFYTAYFDGKGAGKTPTNPRNQVNNQARKIVAF